MFKGILGEVIITLYEFDVIYLLSVFEGKNALVNHLSLELFLIGLFDLYSNRVGTLSFSS